MNVAIERSSLGNVDLGIPVGFGPNGEVIRSPIINTTRAQTRVSAFDNQTVVFAGLITKTRSSRSRRIPFLADIPVAGALFRFDSESESRTELLVVMTPRIIQSPDEMTMHNDTETSRMSWCLADVLNIHGDPSLQAGNGLWGPAASPVIFPDVEPAVSFDPYGRPQFNSTPGETAYGMTPPVIDATAAPPQYPALQGEPPVEIAPNVQPMGFNAPGQGPSVVPAIGMSGNFPNNVGTPLTPINLNPEGSSNPR